MTLHLLLLLHRELILDQKANIDLGHGLGLLLGSLAAAAGDALEALFGLGTAHLDEKIIFEDSIGPRADHVIP